jgi:hypothetical protein
MATTISQNSNKSMVMRAAWAMLKKAEVANISEGLKLAWKAIKLKIAMAKGVVTFQYRKASGEVRTAIGTLKSGIVNYEPKGTNRKPCYSTVAYWDIERKGFRSFCISHLI